MASLFETQPFYHQTLRNLILAFGNFFTGIKIRKVNNGVLDKLIPVPIELAPRNKWVERNQAEPDLMSQKVEMTMPRLAFEIVDYSYDPNRKVGPKGFYTTGNIGTNRAKLFNPIPYDVGINLYSICKTQEESLQIFEQIAPYFAPSITLSIEMLPQFNLKKDVPIVLRNVAVEDTYQGSPEQFRTVTQTFSFIAQVDLWGPIIESNKIIKVANADISGTIPEADDPKYLSSNDDNRYTAAVNPKAAMPNDPHVIDEVWWPGE